ncbi:MAG: IS66 family insertion sequence element accessory protein TnpA [bacterium]
MSHRRKQSRPPAARIAFVKKYLESGLTQKAFCQRENLVHGTFHSWLRKYRATRRRPRTSSRTRRGFIPLCVQPATTATHAASCTLEYPNGILIHFSGAVDAQLLSSLLRALEAES